MKKLHIIQPHRQPSSKVNSMAEIMEDVNAMSRLLNKELPQNNQGYALHHSQVVKENPKNFFVIHRHMRPMFQGYSMIANVRLIDRSDPRAFKERCLSYPFRKEKNTKRYYRIVITCEVEHDLGGILRTTELELQGIAAYIVQHEIDHGKGKFIYDNN